MNDRISRTSAPSVWLLALGAAGLVATGCSSSPATATAANNDGGSTSSTSSSASTSSSSSSGSSDAGADASTLFDRLGENSGITSALEAVVAQELTNGDIASYFFFQAGAPANGHPTEDQVILCLTQQLGSAAGGTQDTYPTTVTDDAGSWTCRDMFTVHQPLFISSGTFDTFVLIAANELATLGVAQSDIAAIGTVLNTTKSAVVNPFLTDAGPDAETWEAGFAAAGGDGGTEQ